MVAVRMGHQDCIQMVHPVTQHLLPEIRTNVKQDITITHLQES
jgi:hypothetical protein